MRRAPPEPDRIRRDCRLDVGADLPQAKRSRHEFTRLFWLVPALGLAYLAWLLYSDWAAEGSVIRVTLPDAPGVQADKTPLQYRGIEVGIVSGTELKGDDGVVVSVRLRADSQDVIAREGSEFWVVEPKIDVQGIQGLRAIISGPYLQVRPGDGPPAREFVGLRAAPAVELPDPGLDVVLLSDRVGSAGKGSPVVYRKIQIGEVTRADLSDDARAVELYVHVEPRYAPLVRQHSVFWNAGHIDVDVGLLGAEIDIPALRSLLSGAIAMATPDPPGKPAAPDTAYVLYPQGKDEWQTWAPRIALPTRSKEVGNDR